MSTVIFGLPALVSTLESSPPPTSEVLSVYLATTPDRLIGRAYLLAFRDGCKELRAAAQEAEHPALDAAIAQAERYLTTVAPVHPGVALFASGRDAYFHATPLPSAPEDLVSWDAQPHLAPLLAILDEEERVAVALFDKEHARLFTLYMRAVETRLTIVDAVEGKQRTGGWYALAQTRLARRHEQQVARHARRTIATLMGLLRAQPFDHLLLGGPDEALAVLRDHLPRPLRARLAGRLDLPVTAAEPEVLQTALQLADLLAQQAELVDVENLVQAAGARRAVLGIEPTLAALGERRVHRLLVAEAPTLRGQACARCGRLTTTGSRCALCGGPLTTVGDLRERAMTQAREQGASIEVVAGAAAMELVAAGGLGAWIRH